MNTQTELGAETARQGHWVIRDGSWWRCTRCGLERPFGQGMPDMSRLPCRPVRWGDDR